MSGLLIGLKDVGLKDVSLKDVSLKDVSLKHVSLKDVGLKDVVVPTGPWAHALVMTNSLSDPITKYMFFMILFGLFDLILLFARQICHVNCETENWK